jgi:hypothetical protein
MLLDLCVYFIVDKIFFFNAIKYFFPRVQYPVRFGQWISEIMNLCMYVFFDVRCHCSPSAVDSLKHSMLPDGGPV